MTATVIGVDPGKTTGIALIGHDVTWAPATLVQSSPGGVLAIVHTFMESARDQGAEPGLAVERFVSGPRSGKLATPAGATIAKQLMAELAAWAEAHAVEAHLHSAGEVKPWATDTRLKAAGIEHRGMPHALDAARHALFSACRYWHVPDPLSRRSGGSAGRSMLFEPAVGAPQHSDGGT